jgi:hypothetical protein
LLPRADANAAYGRSVILRLSAQRVRHLDTTERKPPVMSTYSASAADLHNNLILVNDAKFRATGLK